MKKAFRSAVTLLLAVLLLSSLGISAFADSLVTYGADRQFHVLPDADIFDAFKSVMPGDSITETISIRNEYTGAGYVYIYLQAVPHNPTEGPHVPQVAASESYAGMMEFLKQLNLTVTQNGKPLSSDTADKTAGLTQRRLVGVFRGRGQSSIEATLTVPITMGNEFAGRMGEIDWVFIAEEWNDPVNLKTGDDSNAALWCAVLSLSVLLMALAFFLVKRRKNRA